MPRYHFNVEDGLSGLDQDGTELPDLNSAQIEAVRLGGAMLREGAEQFWKGQQWKMDVTDAGGTILFKLIFVAVDGTVQPSHLGHEMKLIS
jgi:hypothetical protein